MTVTVHYIELPLNSLKRTLCCSRVFGSLSEAERIHATSAAEYVTCQLKLREGDQPLPVVNDEPDIQTLVIEDIRERREVGIKRYGTALQPHNGRDALRDAYEEAIDLAMYLKQLIVERGS